MTIQSNIDFNSSVSLRADLSDGIDSAIFSPETIIIPPGGTANSVLVVQASSETVADRTLRIPVSMNITFEIPHTSIITNFSMPLSRNMFGSLVGSLSPQSTNVTATILEPLPLVPSEYLIPLYGIIASTIIGWSIPSIIGWIKSRLDVRKLNYYHKKIISLYADGKLDENDIEPLNRLRNNILDAYSEGKINDKHYESLRNEISILYETIFRKSINSLNDNNPSDNKTIQKQLAQIKNEVKYAYSEGKIIDKHYDLLNEDISNITGRDDTPKGY